MAIGYPNLLLPLILILSLMKITIHGTTGSEHIIDPANMKPVLKLNFEGGAVKVQWEKGHADSVRLEKEAPPFLPLKLKNPIQSSSQKIEITACAPSNSNPLLIS